MFWNQVGADFKTTKLFSSGTSVIKVRFKRAHLISFFWSSVSSLYSRLFSRPKITQLQRSHQLQWTQNSPLTSITPFSQRHSTSEKKKTIDTQLQRSRLSTQLVRNTRKKKPKKLRNLCEWFGTTTRRWQKLDYLLGLGVLTVEMSSNERKAQPWIFFGVNGDEDCVGLVFWFSALREDWRERDKDGKEGIKKG